MARTRNNLKTAKDSSFTPNSPNNENDEIFEFTEATNDAMLSEAVNEKDYAKQDIVIDGDVPNQIPIQSIESPVISLEDLTGNGESAEVEVPIEQPTKKANRNEHKNRDNYDFEERELPLQHHKNDPPENPYMTSELPNKEKRKAAEKMADMILFGYKWIWEMGYNVFKMDEDKLMQKAVRGKFDMNLLKIELPIGEGISVTVLEFLNDYNEKLNETCTVSDDFISEVRPVLIRVFEKRGIGMTDEQYLLYLVGQDVISRTTNLIGLKVAVGQVLALSRDMLSAGLATQANHNRVMAERKRAADLENYRKEMQEQEDDVKAYKNIDEEEDEEENETNNNPTPPVNKAKRKGNKVNKAGQETPPILDDNIIQTDSGQLVVMQPDITDVDILSEKDNLPEFDDVDFNEPEEAN